MSSKHRAFWGQGCTKRLSLGRGGCVCGRAMTGLPGAFPAWLGTCVWGHALDPAGAALRGRTTRQGDGAGRGYLSGPLALPGVQQLSTRLLCLLPGEAECPFHGNLAGDGAAGPGKLSRAALLVLREHQARSSANQERGELLSWANLHSRAASLPKLNSGEK